MRMRKRAELNRNRRLNSDYDETVEEIEVAEETEPAMANTSGRGSGAVARAGSTQVIADVLTNNLFFKA